MKEYLKMLLICVLFIGFYYGVGCQLGKIGENSKVERITYVDRFVDSISNIINKPFKFYQFISEGDDPIKQMEKR